MTSFAQVGRLIVAPIRSGRTRREVAYVLVSVFWAIPPFVLAVLGIVSGALSIVIFGLALLAGVLFLARHSVRYARVPARRLLGWDWPDPPPPPRVLAVFSDAAAWRALAFGFLHFPLLYVGAYGVVVGLFSGVAALTGPAWWFIEPNPFDLFGTTGWGQAWIRAGQGAVLLLTLPWFVRLIVYADGLLARALLHPTRAARRIAQLEEGRAALQADATALLRRVERDLHDGTQARLVSLGVALSRIEHRSTDDQLTSLAAAARDTVTEALAELREIVRGMHPPALDDGLDVALTSLAARSAVPTDVTVTLSGRPPAATASALYFAVAELLTNIARHANATRARIDLVDDARQVTLTVHDDGQGGATIGSAARGDDRSGSTVAAQAARCGDDLGGGPVGVGSAGGGVAAGTGLGGLARRASALDGRLEVLSPVGGPTVVTMTLPRGY